MDAHSRTNDNLENQHSQKLSRRIFNVSHVFQSFWIRRSIRTNNAINGIVSSSRPYFLWHFNIILYLVFCLFKKGKV